MWPQRFSDDSFSYSQLLTNEDLSLSDEEFDHEQELDDEENLRSISKTQTKCSKKSIILISTSLVILLCGASIITVLNIKQTEFKNNKTKLSGNLNPIIKIKQTDPSNQTYPTFKEINQRMKDLKKSLENMRNVSLMTIGDSIETNPIKLLSISPLSELRVMPPLVWVVCGVHAREWTVPYTCLQFLEKLKSIFQSTEDNILGFLRYKFILVANPDGYIYSMSGERMARKNRHTGYCSENDGVDINRNFPVGFEKTADFCSDHYAGPEAFSEPESRAIRDSLAADVPWLFLSVHGNGQVWSVPYAYKNSTAPLAKISEMKFVVEKIEEKFGTLYRSGSSSQTMYLVGGTLMDWVYEHLKVSRTFLLELKSIYPDDEAGINHFQPPLNEVKRDIVPEAWFGFKTLIEISYKNYISNISS